MPQIADAEVQRLDAADQKEQSFLVQVATLIAIAGFFGYLLVDNAVAPTKIWQLLAVRLTTNVGIFFIWWAARKSVYRLRTQTLSAAFYLVVCAGIIVCSALAGGTSTSYHEPLALMYVCYAGFLPTTFKKAAFLFTMVTAGYSGTMAAFGVQGAPAVFLQTIFLLILASIIGVAFIYANQLLRARARSAQLREIDAKMHLHTSNEELRRVVGELNAAYELLKGLDLAKNSFFANVSHELRTPLMLILAALEDLQAKLDAEGQHTTLFSELDKSTVRLLWLIDELLELSRLESATANLKPTAFVLNDFLTELAKTAGALAAKKDIRVIFASPDVAVHVLADRKAIDRVVLNLLTNAIKFTPAGGSITVSLLLNDAVAAVTVADTGAGISASDLPRVFERFYQGEGGKSLHRGGVGIGLSMCQKIIELHGGTITINSTLGAGTQVTFTLPKAATSVAALMPEEAQDGAAAAAQPLPKEGLPEWSERVRSQDRYRLSAITEVSERRAVPRDTGSRKSHSLLVVDDNPSILTMINNIASSDYTIFTAGDGAEGLERARRLRPDVIIADVSMPRMTGFEMLAAIRQDPDLRDMPVILMTARGVEEDRQRSNEYAADAFLPKPFGGKELRPVLARLVARQQSNIDQAAKAAQLATTLVVSGLAHDILNPVSFVKNAAKSLQRHFDTLLGKAVGANLDVSECKEGHERSMSVVRSGLQRVTESVEQLRKVAKGQDLGEPVVVPITPVVQRTVVVTAGTAKLKAAYEARSSVALKPGQMERVLLNLLLNAIQAGGDGCDITVRTSDDFVKNLAVIEVVDKGPGMDAATMQKIFEPHFTTKATGSGLGLAMCRDIVRAHQGQLYVDSHPGEGTSFTIMLPMSKLL